MINLKKQKVAVYLESEKSTILERLDKKFKQHEQIEQKIIERVGGLKKGQNKLADYIAMQKLIDKQLMFLNELECLTDKEAESKKAIPILSSITKLFKRGK